MVFLGKFDILGLPVTACDYDFLLDTLLDKKQKKMIYAPLASHPIMLAQKNNRLKKIYNSFTYLLPDSQYVRFALNYIYGVKLPDRIYGPEFFKKTLALCEKKKIKIYLCGNDVSKVEKELVKINPQISIAGKIELSEKRVSEIDIPALSNNVQKSGAKIIYIGIGSPSQHILANELNVKEKIICVGAAFDLLSKKMVTCPKIIGDMGFEWLFRLIQEPRRLMKRYLIFGILFIFKIIVFRHHSKKK